VYITETEETDPMSTYTCTDCHQPIPAGHAVIRSVSFQRVAYCQPCAAERGIVLAATSGAADRLAS
jgi:hypothetical protein